MSAPPDVDSRYVQLDIRCKHQRQDPSGLYCRLADVNILSSHSTNHTAAEVCVKCHIGRVQRELGCARIGGTTQLFELKALGLPRPAYRMMQCLMFCGLLRKDTDWQMCFDCPNTNRPVVQEQLQEAQGLLTRLGFHEAQGHLHLGLLNLQARNYNDVLSDAKHAAESLMRAMLDSAGEPAADNVDLLGLWRLVKAHKEVWSSAGSEAAKRAGSGVTTLLSALSDLRNSLSSDHGRSSTPAASHSEAELALGCSASLCMFFALQLQETAPK